MSHKCKPQAILTVMYILREGRGIHNTPTHTISTHINDAPARCVSKGYPVKAYSFNDSAERIVTMTMR